MEKFKLVTKKRKGFTLIEVIACTLLLGIVVIGATIVSQQIAVMKTESRNSVYLSLHNLNVMERIRQMSYELVGEEELLSFYDTDMFGDSQYNTNVYIETASFEHFRVYDIRIETRMIGYRQMLVSTYTMTNIGGHHVPDDFIGAEGGTPGDGGDNVLE